MNRNDKPRTKSNNTVEKMTDVIKFKHFMHGRKERRSRKKTKRKRRQRSG